MLKVVLDWNGPSAYGYHWKGPRLPGMYF